MTGTVPGQDRYRSGTGLNRYMTVLRNNRDFDRYRHWDCDFLYFLNRSDRYQYWYRYRSRSRLFSKNGRVPDVSRTNPGMVNSWYRNGPGTGMVQVPDRYRSVCQERKNYCILLLESGPKFTKKSFGLRYTRGMLAASAGILNLV